MLPILIAHIFEIKELVVFSNNKEEDRQFLLLDQTFKKYKFFALASFVPFLLLNLSVWWSMRNSFYGIISVFSQIALIIIWWFLYILFPIYMYQIVFKVQKDDNLPVKINKMPYPYLVLVCLYTFFQFLIMWQIAQPFLNGVIAKDYT